MQSAAFVVAEVAARQRREQRVYSVDAHTVPPLVDGRVLPRLFAKRRWS